MDWEPIKDKMRKKVINPEGFTIQMAEIKKGHVPDPHRHSHEQVAIILEGECDYYIDGKAYRMIPNSVLVIPPGAEHYIVVTGDNTVVNLDIFTPPKTERKKKTLVHKQTPLTQKL